MAGTMLVSVTCAADALSEKERIFVISILMKTRMAAEVNCVCCDERDFSLCL